MEPQPAIDDLPIVNYGAHLFLKQLVGAGGLAMSKLCNEWAAKEKVEHSGRVSDRLPSAALRPPR
jgi:hypothetical protein